MDRKSTAGPSAFSSTPLSTAPCPSTAATSSASLNRSPRATTSSPLLLAVSYILQQFHFILHNDVLAASPLIHDMLTVNPKNRADIEKICNHWWVNETYDVSCLEISEELANQTPVRLDVLLCLAPPPPQLESEKLVVTGDVSVLFHVLQKQFLLRYMLGV